MVYWLLIIFAVCVGSMVPLQAGVNASLSKYLAHPFQAAFISFLGGALVTGLGCILAGVNFPAPSKIFSLNPSLLIGGLLGAVMVITSIILAPRLGATVLVSSYIAGQLAASVFIDHHGLIGFSQHPLSGWRLLGVLFLAAGIYLVRRF